LGLVHSPKVKGRWYQQTGSANVMEPTLPSRKLVYPREDRIARDFFHDNAAPGRYASRPMFDLTGKVTFVPVGGGWS
jgi:hypothetical protein